uniref:Uncharacterized protein n=1 Tax=Arion vulgaris TaxID=1028688 RepID=A0A0B6ZPC6_9EUPU
MPSIQAHNIKYSTFESNQKEKSSFLQHFSAESWTTNEEVLVRCTVNSTINISYKYEYLHMY